MNAAILEVMPPPALPSASSANTPPAATNTAENAQTSQGASAAANSADTPDSFAQALHASSTRSTPKAASKPSTNDAGANALPVPQVPLPLQQPVVPTAVSGINPADADADADDGGLTQQTVLAALAGRGDHSGTAADGAITDGQMLALSPNLVGLMAGAQAAGAKASSTQAGLSAVTASSSTSDTSAASSMAALFGDPGFTTGITAGDQGSFQQLFGQNNAKHGPNDSVADDTSSLLPAADSLDSPTTGDASATSATASQASASATASSGTESSNPMEKAVAGQVTRALMQQLPGGDRMLVVRMTPPELGTVSVQVTEHQGQLTAQLHAEDDGVRQAIEHFLPSMRAELHAHDAPIHELSLADQSQFRSFSQSQQPRDQSFTPRQQAPSESFALAGVSADSTLTTATTSLGGTVDATGVDVRA